MRRQPGYSVRAAAQEMTDATAGVHRGARRHNGLADRGGRAAARTALIGFLSGATESTVRSFTAVFRQSLGEQGYFEGRNVDILYRWADYQYDRLPALAAELAQLRVALIFATGGAAAPLAAKAATATIPIVFQLGTDPVEVGLVASLNRPGGNVTGITFLTTALVAKRLQLLHEIAPAAVSIGFMINPTAPQVETETREAESAARTLGVRLTIIRTSTTSDVEAAFAFLAAQRIGAVSVSGDPLFFNRRRQIAELAARHAVPAIYDVREYVDAGGLMSYGTSFYDSYRLAGTYAGRILNGEKPADLPVQQSTRIEMIINLKTAKALGLTVPQSILLRADEVIE